VISAVSVLRLRALVRLLRLKVRLLERRERDLLEAVGRLCEASRESSQDVLSVLERAVRDAAPGIDAVMVFEAAGEELTALRVMGERTRHFGAARYRLDGPPTPLTRAALGGHRAILCAGMSPLIPTDRGALAVPLGDGAAQSVVYVSTPKSRGIENADTVVRLIEQARAPFALAREREADRAKATYDGLTGLLTARAFRALLADEFNFARIARDATLSLWFIDTDHFKPVNDTFGHGAGDIVLQRMAQLIGAHAHAGLDHVARNGGDEFCAIIKNVPKSNAIMRAQKLCEAVAEFDFGVDIRISASIGVASFPGDANSAHELLEVADAAMYHSKRSGRNGVSFPVAGSAFERYVP
jgi:diguanylate cyclase (GGDEF)-like protein